VKIGNARMKGGFTLVECMLASAILGVSCLVLFEGVGVCARVAHENAQLLAAEGVAWDAVWKRFNESYDDLVLNESTGWQNLSDAAAPSLAGLEPKIRVSVLPMTTEGRRADMKVIQADVEWGPATARRRLSDGGHDVRVCRGSLGRAP